MYLLTVVRLSSGRNQNSVLQQQCFLAVVQLLSCVQLFAILWTAAHQASLSFTVSWSLLKFMSIEFVMPSNHLILCHPLLLLPSIFLSIRVFSNELALHIRWPNTDTLPLSQPFSPSKYSIFSSLRVCFFSLEYRNILGEKARSWKTQ